MLNQQLSKSLKHFVLIEKSVKLLAQQFYKQLFALYQI